MKTKSLALIAIIVVAVVAVGYYFEPRSATNSQLPAVTVDITIVGGVGTGTTDTYAPNNFTVREGQQVTLAVLNTDDNTHGLVIDQFKVDTRIIHAGATQRVTFVANQTGTFMYYEPPSYCQGGVGNVCNSQQNMVGKMTVLP